MMIRGFSRMSQPATRATPQNEHRSLARSLARGVASEQRGGANGGGHFTFAAVLKCAIFPLQPINFSRCRDRRDFNTHFIQARSGTKCSKERVRTPRNSYLVFHDYFPKLRVTVHLIITVPHRIFKREVFSSASNYKTRTLTTTRLHDPLRGAPPEASVPPPFSPLPLSRPSPSSSPHLLPSRLAPSRLAPSRLASSPYAALAIAPTPRWAFS